MKNFFILLMVVLLSSCANKNHVINNNIKITTDNIINVVQNNKKKNIFLIGEKYTFAFTNDNYKTMDKLIRLLQESNGWSLNKKPSFSTVEGKTSVSLEFKVNKIRDTNINEKLEQTYKKRINITRTYFDKTSGIKYERYPFKCFLLKCFDHQDYIKINFNNLIRIKTNNKLRQKKSLLKTIIPVYVEDKKLYRTQRKKYRKKGMTEKIVKTTIFGTTIVAYVAALAAVAIVASPVILISQGMKK